MSRLHLSRCSIRRYFHSVMTQDSLLIPPSSRRHLRNCLYVCIELEPMMVQTSLRSKRRKSKKLFDITMMSQRDHLHSKTWLEHTSPIIQQPGKVAPRFQKHVVSGAPVLDSTCVRDDAKERVAYGDDSVGVFLGRPC